MQKNNQQVFIGPEYNLWAYKSELLPDERYCIEKYLRKDAKTLEAGTGGGRILLALKDLGFTSLYGYDYLPEMINEAKMKDSSNSISFEVQNATCLEYPDSSFEQILYIQQIISVIETEEDRQKGIKEAYRILKDDGTALFSFLIMESSQKRFFHRAYRKYLQALRLLALRKRSIQYQPWHRYGGKFNWGLLTDSSPNIYYFTIKEAWNALTDTGFIPIAIGSSSQFSNGIAFNNVSALSKEPVDGALYIVCKK